MIELIEVPLKQSNLIDLIVAGWASKDQCPALVKAINIHPAKKSKNRWYFDLVLIKYLKEDGRYPVGYVHKNLSIDNYIRSKTGVLTNKNPFAIRKKRGVSQKERNLITATLINKICKEKKYGCNFHKKIFIGKVVHLSFWHKSHGYSVRRPVASSWVNKPSDPFAKKNGDMKCIDAVQGLIFDNKLSGLYEISPQPPVVIRSKENIRRIGIFCLIHSTHVVASVQHILNRQVFNCPQCRKKDHFGSTRIRELKLNLKKDAGSTIVYLVRLKINSIETLKFGITKALGNFSSVDCIKERFSSKVFDLVEIIRKHLCESELDALINEAKMLDETISLINNEVSRRVPGATECRVYNKKAEFVCKCVFDDVIFSKFI